MAFLLPILLAVLLSLLGGLYFLGAFRQRRPGEPPLDKGPIPWLGYSLEFRKNNVKFLERMRKKHGDIFTVQLGGKYCTFIMDPHSYGAVVKRARAELDFLENAKSIAERIFNYTIHEKDAEFLDIANKRHLMGDGLDYLSDAMMNNLQKLMLHSIGTGEGQKTWIEDRLFIYCYNTVFIGGYLSLFGNVPPETSGSTEKANEMERQQSEKLFSGFHIYDKIFSKQIFGILKPREMMTEKRLKKLFWSELSVQKLKTRNNVSGWVTDAHQMRAEIGMKQFMQDRYMFILLWASQSNTGPSSFWLLLYLLKHPEAMTAVKDEVDKIVRESGQEVRRGGPLINLTRDMMQKTPILDSVIEETLRLSAATFLTRAVLQDMTLKMADGQGYGLRKGDFLFLFPYTAFHIDPEIHPDPQSFKYDRFLNPDGSRKTAFYKGGKKLKASTMPWGAGISMCPGRFFATNELKQFVFLMLLYFDMELTNPDEEIPNFDIMRCGLGTMHPIGDMNFRYRPRF